MLERRLFLTGSAPLVLQPADLTAAFCSRCAAFTQVIRTKPYPWKSGCNLFEGECMSAWDAANPGK
jgi:hypothetical protein